MILALWLSVPRVSAAPPAVGAALTTAAATVTVELRDDLFDPPAVRIEPGDSVLWINRGRNPHNVIRGRVQLEDPSDR